MNEQLKKITEEALSRIASCGTQAELNEVRVAYLGKKGKVIAPLRPAGTAVIDGERVDVVSFGDYIDKDAEIEVVKIEGSKLLVKQINN